MWQRQNAWRKPWASWLRSSLLCCGVLMSNSVLGNMATAAPDVAAMFGQKLMLDLRYYCAEPVAAGQCRTPLTELPPELFQLIRQHNIGGVILFAENLQTPAQIIRLTRQLQQAAAESSLGLPLFIGIDQEGGRVARLPRHWASSFSGNMAIGATYAEHGSHFASEVSRILAIELLALGINVNFAPTVDVNVNPQNPVINVRSYGEDAQRVAELGSASTQAMQQQGVLAALKHFPGHGDTHIDSHLGLPRVDHSAEQISRIDLYPFARIILDAQPAMIMTAHIQYPALDSSTFIAKDGQPLLKPATLSRTILTGVLREQLNYQGLIVTDALDMAGISHFFSPTEAVVATFAAGADIALMPLKVQSPAELAALPQLIAQLEAALAQQQLDAAEVVASYARIRKAKQQLRIGTEPEAEALKQAKQVLGQREHRAAELALARAAVTVVKGEAALPLRSAAGQRWLLLMPDTSKALALQHALQQLLAQQPGTAPLIEILSLQQLDMTTAKSKVAAADLLISGFISPMQSLVEMGGMDDLTPGMSLAVAYQQQRQQFAALLQQRAALQKPTVFISLRSPYEIADYAPYADWVLASYAYHTEQAPGQTPRGVVYQALAEVLLGKISATGQLPVTVEAIK